MSDNEILIVEPEIRNINELTNWEDNPRSIQEEEFERLKKQIRKLGMYKPLLVNQHNVVLGGNMRLRALKDLGVNGDVYVNVVDADTPEKMMEYALSDNDQMGMTDELKVAEYTTLHPIETELYSIQPSTPKPLEKVLEDSGTNPGKKDDYTVTCPNCNHEFNPHEKP